MKKLGFFILSILMPVMASAQQVDSTDTDVPHDMVVNVFNTLPMNVSVRQTRQLKEAVIERSAKNASKMQQGYRVRLFFDNRQDAREKSYQVYHSFIESYPNTPAYRVFDSPFFKVTVGDFRTKAEAMAFMKELSTCFPSAFIVREQFRYPALDMPEKIEPVAISEDE